jgi:hypothetical protein
VGKQKQLTIAEAMRDLAATELYPGETMIALCTFFASGTSTFVKGKPARLLSLTEGNLRYMQPNWSGRGFERVETRALDRVASFTTSYVKNFPLIPDQHVLELRWEGERLPERLASPYREAREFITTFKDVIARRQSRSSGGTAAEELERLAKLRAEGILSDDEWDRAKSLYLGRPPQQQDEALRMLRNLHEMMKSGVLSESEFRTKKWELLSTKLK